MSQNLIETLTSTPEGMALFQQERLILEVTELICGLMDEQGVSRAELAKRLGKSRPYVTQLLDGRANMTLRTVSDALSALGSSLHVCAGPIAVDTPAPEPEVDPVVLRYVCPDPTDRPVEITTTVVEAARSRSKSFGTQYELTA